MENFPFQLRELDQILKPNLSLYLILPSTAYTLTLVADPSFCHAATGFWNHRTWTKYFSFPSSNNLKLW